MRNLAKGSLTLLGSRIPQQTFQPKDADSVAWGTSRDREPVLGTPSCAALLPTTPRAFTSLGLQGPLLTFTPTVSPPTCGL